MQPLVTMISSGTQTAAEIERASRDHRAQTVIAGRHRVCTEQMRLAPALEVREPQQLVIGEQIRPRAGGAERGDIGIAHRHQHFHHQLIDADEACGVRAGGGRRLVQSRRTRQDEVAGFGTCLDQALIFEMPIRLHRGGNAYAMLCREPAHRRQPVARTQRARMDGFGHARGEIFVQMVFGSVHRHMFG
jgi:hypothetical protein